jgi:hypothetical protein
MGIRFACHVCEKQLNIKQELAGRRGICPACSSRFRIPLQDAEKSSPVEKKVAMAAGAQEPVPLDDANPVAESPAGSIEKTDKSPETAGRVSVDEVDLFDSEPNATWYVRPPSGGQYGPASGELLKEWIKEGRVASTSLLWRDGWAQWRDASDVLPDLSKHLPQSSVANRSSDNQSVGDSFLGSSSSVANANSQGVPKPQVSDQRESGDEPRFSGASDVGATRRSRSTRRVMLIGVLSALAIALVCVLFYVANR